MPPSTLFLAVRLSESIFIIQLFLVIKQALMQNCFSEYKYDYLKWITRMLNGATYGLSLLVLIFILQTWVKEWMGL